MLTNPSSWYVRSSTPLLFYNQMRVFGAQAKVEEPKTITELHEIGLANLALTKRDGLDYDGILNTKNFGLKNKEKTFTSFEDEINK